MSLPYSKKVKVRDGKLWNSLFWCFLRWDKDFSYWVLYFKGGGVYFGSRICGSIILHSNVSMTGLIVLETCRRDSLPSDGQEIIASFYISV